MLSFRLLLASHRNVTSSPWYQHTSLYYYGCFHSIASHSFTYHCQMKQRNVSQRCKSLKAFYISLPSYYIQNIGRRTGIRHINYNSFTSPAQLIRPRSECTINNQSFQSLYSFPSFGLIINSTGQHSNKAYMTRSLKSGFQTKLFLVRKNRLSINYFARTTFIRNHHLSCPNPTTLRQGQRLNPRIPPKPYRVQLIVHPMVFYV